MAPLEQREQNSSALSTAFSCASHARTSSRPLPPLSCTRAAPSIPTLCPPHSSPLRLRDRPPAAAVPLIPAAARRDCCLLSCARIASRIDRRPASEARVQRAAALVSGAPSLSPSADWHFACAQALQSLVRSGPLTRRSIESARNCFSSERASPPGACLHYPSSEAAPTAPRKAAAHHAAQTHVRSTAAHTHRSFECAARVPPSPAPTQTCPLRSNHNAYGA